MKGILSLFRMFQDPLNDVCIQDFEDAQHIVAIEQSITKGADTVDEYLCEQVNQLLRSSEILIGYVCKRDVAVAKVAWSEGSRLLESVDLQQVSGQSVLQGNY
jgi:hypothetical protein